jgi:hypothetical protein
MFSAVLATIGAALLSVLGSGSAAWATTQPNSVSIQGTGMTKPLVVQNSTQAQLFSAMLNQVAWMAGRAGDPMTLNLKALGPKYSLTVLADKTAMQKYDLYPEASGGPRAHRAAAQPQGHTSDAWFYASVAMPEVLLAAGVPLPMPTMSGSAQPFTNVDPAGFIPAATTEAQPLSLSKALTRQERTLLIWLATAFGVLLLVLLAALNSRRYGR